MYQVYPTEPRFCVYHRSTNNKWCAQDMAYTRYVRPYRLYTTSAGPKLIAVVIHDSWLRSVTLALLCLCISLSIWRVGCSVCYVGPHILLRNQLPRALSSVGRRNSMRVNKGRTGWGLVAVNTQERIHTVVSRGKKNLLSDPGSQLRLGSEK